MAAPITGIGHLPRSLSLKLMALTRGLYLMAAMAGKYNALRRCGAPIFESRALCLIEVPDSCRRGASLAKAAS